MSTTTSKAHLERLRRLAIDHGDGEAARKLLILTKRDLVPLEWIATICLAAIDQEEFVVADRAANLLFERGYWSRRVGVAACIGPIQHRMSVSASARKDGTLGIVSDAGGTTWGSLPVVFMGMFAIRVLSPEHDENAFIDTKQQWLEYFRKQHSWVFDLPALPSTTGSVEHQLHRGIASLARLFHQHTRALKPPFHGGASIAAVSFFGTQISIVNVGDSRVYRLSNGVLQQLSRDDTLLTEYLTMGLCGPGDIKSFPHRNINTNWIGLKAKTRLNVRRTFIQPGDRFLLCTANIFRALNNATITQLLSSSDDPNIASERLVQSAYNVETRNRFAVACHFIQGPTPSESTA